MDEVTTFCHLWILEFPNRPSLFLTDHDDVIHYDNQIYYPQNSGVAGITETHTGLAVDSGGVRTKLTLPNLSNEEIGDGALDTAQLSKFRHDWRSGETTLLSKGRIGEVSFSDQDISVEWLGQSSLLDRSTGRVFSRQCDASFGDARCGLSLSDFPEGTICPRSFQVCRDQFSNSVNFRGFPYLLGDNVLQAGVRDSDIRDGSSRYR